MKLIEIHSNESFSEDKKEVYKQFILNFSNNLYVENLEKIVDILIATKNRDIQAINKIIDTKSFKQTFVSSTARKEARVIKLNKILILVYWPIGCLSPETFNRILFESYREIREEVLSLEYDEILNYIRTIKNINFNDLFYKSSSKNINFNHFISEFTKYKPKDFQMAFKSYIALFGYIATEQYLVWFFTEKVPNKWELFTFSIEYIEQKILFRIDDRIEIVFKAKLEIENFIESFEKLNFNPYKNTNILKILKGENIFLKNIVTYIEINKESIDSYGWLSFYIYASKQLKEKFIGNIADFFKSKSFGIQNRILVYYFSFYTKFEKVHFEFLFNLLYLLDADKFEIPNIVKKMQTESPLGLYYEKSYVFIKSLQTRGHILEFLYKRIKINFIYNFEDMEKIWPAVYYAIYSNDANITSESQIEHEEIEKIIKFISLIN